SARGSCPLGTACILQDAPKATTVQTSHALSRETWLFHVSCRLCFKAITQGQITTCNLGQDNRIFIRLSGSCDPEFLLCVLLIKQASHLTFIIEGRRLR